ncbi:nicotinamide nmethyltransferase [Pelomyxa schiedti]|nr:nicotinamide nmethyltransferase [Pelomyxa schiedti]
MFDEPEGFFAPDKKPITQYYTRRALRGGCCCDGATEAAVADPNNNNVRTLPIRLVSDHPLYGHLLWNAGISLSDFLESDPAIIRAKSVLELGAGGGLPSIICALEGAKRVVITDYPDEPLLENIRYNVNENIPATFKAACSVEVMGHLWGKAPESLLGPGGEKFDVILLSDLIFNHSCHVSMLETCVACLKPQTGKIIVTYSHHVPRNADKDLMFFTLAKNPPFNFMCEHLWDRVMQPMFPEDSGPVEVRSQVHCYLLTLP